MPITITTQSTIYQLPEDAATARPILLGFLSKATATIDIEDYAFSDKAIIEALQAASKRGVRLRVLLDYSESHQAFEASLLPALRAAVPADSVRLVTSPVSRRIIDHKKQIIADGRIVMRGSTNLTLEAWQEANTLEVTTSKKLAAALLPVFEAHWNYAGTTEKDLQPA